MPNVGKILEKIKLKSPAALDEPMSRHSWFRIGGPADALVAPGSREELARLLAAVTAEGVPFFILGGGANILVSDRGIRGVVIDMSNLRGCRVLGNGPRLTLSALSGTPVDEACTLALERELTGLEFLYSMPGSIGGSVWMNARCYGRSLSDILTSVEYLDDCGGPHTLQSATGLFDYKRSPFQTMRAVIVEATVALDRGRRTDIASRMEEHRRDREAKGHFQYPCAGSIFKNNRSFGSPTGKLIDSLGLKGLAIGDARVSPLHGNIIVNRGNARAGEVLQLIVLLEDKVREAFGLELEREVQLIGEW